MYLLPWRYDLLLRRTRMSAKNSFINGVRSVIEKAVAYLMERRALDRRLSVALQMK